MIWLAVYSVVLYVIRRQIFVRTWKPERGSKIWKPVTTKKIFTVCTYCLPYFWTRRRQSPFPGCIPWPRHKDAKVSWYVPWMTKMTKWPPTYLFVVKNFLLTLRFPIIKDHHQSLTSKPDFVKIMGEVGWWGECSSLAGPQTLSDLRFMRYRPEYCMCACDKCR